MTEEEEKEEELLLGDGGESDVSTKPSAFSTAFNSRAVQIPFWFGVLCVASVGMTVGNKAIMHVYPYANALSMMQNGITVICLGIGAAANLVQINKITTAQIKIFATTAALLSAQIVTSLLAMPLVEVATMVVFRNLATITVAVLDYTFMGAKFSTLTVAALAVTVVGMTIYAGTDVNYDATGYFWLTMNAAATVGNMMFNKIYITRYTSTTKEQTTYGVTLIQQIETLPLFLIMALAQGEFQDTTAVVAQSPGSKPNSLLSRIIGKSGVPTNHPDAFSAALAQSPGMQALILFTCIGGLVLSTTYARVFSLASSTTVTVAAVCNKAVSIILAHFVFHTTLSLSQIGGLVICISGGLWYSMESKRSGKKTAPIPSKPANSKEDTKV